MYCKNCGYENREDAKYCKKCGTTLKESQGFIQKINQSINILSVFIGLFISVLVLIGGSLLFGSLMANGNLDIGLYIVLVLYSMVLIGAFITGLIGSNEFKDGAINGFVMTLLIIIILGFLIGIIWFIAIGVSAAMASAFSSTPLGTLPTTTTAGMGTDGGSIINIILDILGFLGLFAAGLVGGAAGAYIKNIIRK